MAKRVRTTAKKEGFTIVAFDHQDKTVSTTTVAAEKAGDLAHEIFKGDGIVKVVVYDNAGTEVFKIN